MGIFDGGAKRSSTQWRKYIIYPILLAALYTFFLYLYTNASRYSGLLRFSPGMLAAVVVLVLVGIVLSGVVNYLLYGRLGSGIQLREALGLAAVNSLANQLPFAAGLVAKGIYLKHLYQLTYSSYFSATMALYMVFLMTAGSTGTVVLMTLQFLNDEPASLWLLPGFILMAGSIGILWIPIQRIPFPTSWQERLSQVLEGWAVFSKSKVLTLQIVLVYLVMMLATSGRYWIAFRALSQDVPLANCVLFAAASILTQLVSIAPGGLGVREGIVAAMASIMGFDTGISVIAVGLDRLVATFVISIVGALSTYILSKKALLK